MKTSPLHAFVRTVRAMAEGRRFLRAMNDTTVLLEDLEMMMTENVVIGLRTPWVRRVAVPIHRAWMEIERGSGKPKERAVRALEILQQCTDAALAAECSDWICEHYGVQTETAGQ